MNTSTVKDAQKREKRFKDSSISREELDATIAKGIKLALQEQQSVLDAIVASAVKRSCGLLHYVIYTQTNEVVKEMSTELEKVATAAKRTQDRVDRLLS